MIKQLLPSLLLAAWLPAVPWCQAEAPAAPEAAREALDRRATELMRQYDIPGLALGLSLDGRRFYFNYGFGSREASRPVDEHTLFEIGSISKIFTALVAALAEEQGCLSLADPVSRHLPELKGGAFDEISLEQLASHSSGLPLFPPGGVDSPAALKRYLLAWKPLKSPGSQRVYSNIGPALLGRTTAEALGRPLDELIEKELFARLGLDNTYINVPPDKAGRYAQGYNKNGRPVRLGSDLLAGGAYAVKSGSEDLLLFLEATMGLQPVEPPWRAALDRSLAARYRVGAQRQGLGWEGYDRPANLAAVLGGNSERMIYRANPAEAIDPAAEGAPDRLYNKTGSTAGFSAYVLFIPAQKTGLAILANRPVPIEARIRLAFFLLELSSGFLK